MKRLFFAMLIVFCVSLYLFSEFSSTSRAEDEQTPQAKIEADFNRELEELRKSVVEGWQKLDSAKIHYVTVKLGSFHGFGPEKTSFEAEIKDPKLLALFRLGVERCVIDPPKSGIGGSGLSPNGTIKIQCENKETFQLVFHLYPSHHAKEADKRGMHDGFGFMTIGPSGGGLQCAYSPHWAVFLNEVFTLHKQPKLSDRAFALLSGKNWYESALKEAEAAVVEKKLKEN